MLKAVAILIEDTGGGVISLNGETGALTLTSTGATINITTPTSNTINLEAVGGGGGTPGGSPNNIQVNIAGSFYGDDGLNYDPTTKRVGVQTTAPEAVIHAKSDTGQSPNPVVAFAATLLPESFPTNSSASATVRYQPENSSDANINGTQNDDPSGSYIADGSTNISINIYGYVIVAGQKYFYGTPSFTTFTDNSDSQNFIISYLWTVISGVDGYVLESTGSANNGNPNWTLDVGNTASYVDTGSLSGSDPIPTSFTSLGPYQVITPPDDSAGVAPINTSQNDGSGGYVADSSSSLSYVVQGAKLINGVYYFAGSPPTSSTFNDNNDSSNFSVGISWSTIGGADAYFVTRSGYNTNTGTVGGTINVGNTAFVSDPGNDTWADTPPTLFNITGVPRQYAIQAQSLAPDGTTVYYPTPATYSAVDTNSLPYVIEHDITLNGNTTYGLTGDPSGNSYNDYHLDTLTAIIEGASGFWSPGALGPTHYGYLANGTNCHRFYADYGIASGYYSPTALTAVTTDPNNGQYYYVKLTQTLGAGNSDSKILRGIGSSSYTSGHLSSNLPSSGSDYFDLAFSTWGAGTVVTPNTLYASTGLFESHGSSVNDPATVILRSLDGTYSRLEFQTNGSAVKGYVDTTSGLTIMAVGGGDVHLGPNVITAGNVYAATVILTPATDGGNGLIITPHSGGQTGDLLVFSLSGGAKFNANSTLILAQGTANHPGLIIPVGIAFSGVANGLEQTGGMLNFTDNSGTRHLLVTTDIGQTFTAAQAFTAGISVANSFGQPQIHFANGNLLSTVEGDMMYAGGQYYLSDSTQYRRIARNAGTVALTNNQYVRADANGFLINDNTLFIQSGVILVSSLIFSMAQGGSIAAGSNLTMGAGSAIAGNIRTNRSSKTANFTFTQSNDSPIVVLTGTTASQTGTLPNASTVGNGTWFGAKNESTQNWTIATTSSQTIFTTSALTTVTVKPGEYLQVVSNGTNWDATIFADYGLANTWAGTNTFSGTVNLSALTATRPLKIDGSKNITSGLIDLTSANDVTGVLPVANGGYIANSFSGVGTATTTFTVTIGTTQANNTYKVNATPTNLLATAVFYVNNKTTTTFDVVYLAGLTGTVTFDWALFK